MMLSVVLAMYKACDFTPTWLLLWGTWWNLYLQGFNGVDNNEWKVCVDFPLTKKGDFVSFLQYIKNVKSASLGCVTDEWYNSRREM